MKTYKLTLILAVALCFAACSEQSNVATDLDQPGIATSSDDGVVAKGSPNKDSDGDGISDKDDPCPNDPDPACEGDGGGDPGHDQVDVSSDGAFAFASTPFDAIIDNSSTLYIEAPSPGLQDLSADFSNTRAALISMVDDGDGGAAVSAADIGASISSGACLVDRGRKGTATDEQLATLAETFLISAIGSSHFNMTYDKTADGQASEDHLMVANFDGNSPGDSCGEGVLTLRIGGTATAEMAGSDLVYSGGSVLLWSRRGKGKNSCNYALQCDNLDTATATISAP